jgi:two-component sensor histidine kinase
MAEEKIVKKSLIQRAEEEVKKIRDYDNIAESKDRDSLIHDLKVHQIELEMQNEELRRAQKELEKTKNVYANLYNLAPVGYDKLYRSTDFRNVSAAEYLHALIGEISVAYSDGGRIMIEKEIEDFVIDSKLLFPAGMIINELISNAFKYAFPQESSGTVKVFFKRPDKNLVSLIVSDDGIGISDDIGLGNSTGFGLTLVNMLVSQLKGSADIIRGRGTTFRITFPVGEE